MNCVLIWLWFGFSVAAEWDEKHIMPLDALKKAGELGFGGMYVREDVGGMLCQ